MYYGLQNPCGQQTAIDNGSMYSFNAREAPRAGDANIGSLYAISAETGKTLWRYDQRSAMMSVVATGGGLLFAGDTNGRFRAFDQDSGKILWETNLGAPVTGYPITYSVRRQAIRCRERRQLAGEFQFESPGGGVEAGQSAATYLYSRFLKKRPA